MLSEHIRSLVYILFLSTAFFVYTYRPISYVMNKDDLTRRRNIWIALTFTGFIANNFWLYLLFATLILTYQAKREPNPPAIYFFILFIMPMANISIPGLGMVNYLFDLSHQRMLVLLILIPSIFKLKQSKEYTPFGRIMTDKILIIYLLLTSLLFLREFNLTNNLRQVFYLFIDIFVPYLVISRSLQNLQQFRDAVLSLVIAIMLLVPIAAYEFLFHWLLFTSMTDSLGMEGGQAEYLARDGLLRAIATAGYAITLGYLMVVGMGLYTFIQRSFKTNFVRRLGMLLLGIGLITPLSRGPWLGAVVMQILFVATGPKPSRRLMTLALGGVIALSLVTVLPGGDRVINMLPFVGTTDSENVTYRERLITNSMIVIKRNLFFGSTDFLKTPEMEEMRQGQGIIDLVNNYIQVILSIGLIGLVIFISFFVVTLLGIYRAMKLIADKESEEYLLGRALLSTLIAILFIISTVSSVTLIPIVYWSVAAMGVAYTQMIRKISDRK